MFTLIPTEHGYRRAIGGRLGASVPVAHHACPCGGAGVGVPPTD
ncbi:MAG: hypothetical protein NZM28_00350 [Fimbriimonadales bacterium]|nr:hypothetical protein [Fimbriimonadales bacterium]